ncbi:MAG TPA: CoA transferase, partial [Dehalococcoidia bacterium]|nr:CoA transferase [Dehalococcoidia bacterium]
FPILRGEQILVDPNDEALRTNIAIEHPGIAHEQVLVGAPWKYSKTPTTLFRPTPRFAEHNHEVLSRLLGMTSEEIDRLVEAGVVA